MMGYQKKGGQGSLFQKYYSPIGVDDSWGFDYFDGYFILNELTYASGFLSNEKLDPQRELRQETQFLVHCIFMYFYTL